jgi:hypothetical protein
MPVRLFDLKRGERELVIPVLEEETLRVIYRPGVVTPGFADAFWFQPAEWISQVVVSWDLLGDDGLPVPLRALDEEGRPTDAPSAELRAVPTDALLFVQRAINADLLPGKRLRGTSTAG